MKLFTYICTVMCLSTGTPKSNKFSVCPKWKIYYFYVSQNLGTLQPNNNVPILGHLETIHFPFGTNGKLNVLGVPVYKHFRVCFSMYKIYLHPLV